MGFMNSDGFIVGGVDCCRSGDVLPGFTSLTQDCIPFDVCRTVRSLLLMMSWTELGDCLKVRIGGARSISLKV